jgi:2-polyprenyl-3-methyl-5-hydroxy-6-metoxy-1,4-benzoquinol methylase
MFRKKYDSDYFTSRLFRVFSDDHKIELLKRYLRGKSVLDFGCGSGEILAAMPATCRRVGLDISADGIALAKRDYPGVDFRVLDLEKEAINVRFDTGIALDVFEHLSNPEKVLKKITDLANKKCTLIMSVPNNFGIGGMVFVPVMNKLDATHVSTYERGEWERLLRKTGWKIISEYNKIGSRYYTNELSSYVATSVMFVAKKV